MIKVVSWNIARRRGPLDQLVEMDADVALLQEVGTAVVRNLPAGMATGSRAHWDSYQWNSRDVEDGFRKWCNRWPLVVKLSNRVDIEWFSQVGPSDQPGQNEFAVSDIGLISAARVTPKDPTDGEPFIAVSMYAHWNQKDQASRSSAIIVFDMSSLIRRDVSSSDRILAAGDLNTHYRPGAYGDMESRAPVATTADQFGYSYRIYDESDRYTVVIYRPGGEAFHIRRKRWKTLRGARAWIKVNMEANAGLRRRIVTGETEVEPGVWNRMKAIGLEFMGPQCPNGRQAMPVPDYLPSDTANVVTFHRPGQSVENADQQLDYVFASRGFHERVTTRALNSIDEWGASDHCRLLIEVAAD